MTMKLLPNAAVRLTGDDRPRARRRDGLTAFPAAQNAISHAKIADFRYK
jgi:hypothetical protein